MVCDSSQIAGTSRPGMQIRGLKCNVTVGEAAVSPARARKAAGNIALDGCQISQWWKKIWTKEDSARSPKHSIQDYLQILYLNRVDLVLDMSISSEYHERAEHQTSQQQISKFI